MTQQPIPAYITRCRGCKTVVGAIVDDGNSTRFGDIAEFIADEIRAGRIVFRTTVEEARPLFGECKCGEAQP